MAQIYRFLTEDDTSAFCHKVSRALSRGWVLHGAPQYAYDHANGVMRCGQAVVKEITSDYNPDMTLGEQ